MNSKLLVTKYTDKNNNKYILTANRQFDRIFDLDFTPVTGTDLGNIYIGLVRDIAKNINAAFVEYSKDKKGYLSLETNISPVFLNKKNTSKICEGDYILVQVEKEPIKTKDAVLTTNISIPGKYCVFSYGKNMIGFSGKIKKDILDSSYMGIDAFKEQVSECIGKYMPDNCGFIIRTEAAKASVNEIETEAAKLFNIYNDIISSAAGLKLYTCVYQAKPSYISIIEKHLSSTDEIITDSEKIYNELYEYFDNTDKLRLYEDTRISLSSFYNIETAVGEALNKKIWLKSGGFLIIEQTEAMTVIDVNTGKFEKGKNSEETFLKINKEAASEIGRQLRLRNLSGIIITDFIDMKSEEHKKELITHFSDVLSHDPVKTVLVDITKLGLVEVTRQKIKMPISQFLC
ncbi:MAG: ribonuclease E/G [Lachnospiraceae bacterium]|nr:ribonuclease E/G [Lachnospiraceae bacterium]